MGLYAADYRRIGRQALAGRWGVSILVSFVAALLGGTGLQFRSNSSSNGGTGSYGGYYDSGINSVVQSIFAVILIFVVVYSVAVFIIGAAVELGCKTYYIGLVALIGPPEFRTLFLRFSIFGRALGLRLLMAVKIFAWTLLFIVPGIVASYNYAMAPYLMAQNPNIGAVEAIECSKRMMKGNKGRLFCLHLSFIGWSILCIFTLGIGLLWLAPYRQAAEAAFYLNIIGQLPGQLYWGQWWMNTQAIYGAQGTGQGYPQPPNSGNQPGQYAP